MTERKGIDVSEWNDGLKYSEIAKEIEFVIPREGYRCRRDHLFLDHVKGFQAAGVKVPGVYHFIYAVSEYEAREEAKSCIKNVKIAGLPDSITIWSDMEYDSIDKAESNRGITLGPPEVNRITRAFLEEIAAAGYRCGIYTNLDFYRNWYNSSMLSSYPLWFAQYTNAKKPAVDDCEIWQYSSKGVIAGATLDLDTWYDRTEKKPEKKPEQKPAAEKITAGETACRWMEAAATDPSHGYDQRYRWGEKGDYDCSSAIIQAVEESGILVKTAGATYTGNIARVFKMLGFKDVTGSVNLQTGAGLLRSDILLNHVHHVAMYCGNGLEVEASINEKGGATGGAPGDQTGREFLIRPYRNYPWDCVLRFPDVTDKTEGETTNTKPDGLSKIPKYVACVTASRLNVRTWAGTEYPKIKSYPFLNFGNLVDVCEEISDARGNPWAYVRIAGRAYGFVSRKYLRRQ